MKFLRPDITEVPYKQAIPVAEIVHQGTPPACEVCVPAGYALSSTQELMALNHPVVANVIRYSKIVFHHPDFARDFARDDRK
jgi:hypothetical protein